MTLEITPVNDMPESIAESYSVLFGETFESTTSVLANDADIDGDALEAILLTPPENGRVTLRSDGTFEFEPDQGFFGTDSFTYIANDGVGGSSQPVTVNLTVDFVDAGIVNDLNSESRNNNSPADPAELTTQPQITINEPELEPDTLDLSLIHISEPTRPY